MEFFNNFTKLSYTVSINVLSTLLKTINPMITDPIMNTILYSNPFQLKFPLMNKAYRKDSTTLLKGLRLIRYLYLDELRKDIGYPTGVTYIHSCTINVIKITKSRYFVVSDEMIIPNPKPRPATIKIRKGIHNQEKCTLTGLPFILKTNIATRRRLNWMTKRIKFDSTTDSGIINLGKYTFPNIEALFTKVFEVLVRQTEK
jgi:hypothetical protein